MYYDLTTSHKSMFEQIIRFSLKILSTKDGDRDGNKLGELLGSFDKLGSELGGTD